MPDPLQPLIDAARGVAHNYHCLCFHALGRPFEPCSYCKLDTALAALDTPAAREVREAERELLDSMCHNRSKLDKNFQFIELLDKLLVAQSTLAIERSYRATP
jgi:hypothetical protein